MQKKVLALDLDDTTVVYHEKLCAYVNRTYGHQFKKEQFTSPRFEEGFGVSKAQMDAWVREFDRYETRLTLPLMPGAYELISILAEHYSIHVVTNRPVEIQDGTNATINQLLPNLITEAHFCTKDWGATKLKTKSKACADIGARIILEDNLVHTEDCVRAGIRVLLMKQPWNQNHQLEWWLYYGAIMSINNWHDPDLRKYLL